MLVQQLQQAAHQVREDRVARGLGDGPVKGHVGLHLSRTVCAGVGRRNLGVTVRQSFQVSRLGACCGQLRAADLQHLAELQQIGLHSGLALQHLLPGVRTALVRPLGDEGAGAMAALQQATFGQHAQRFAQSRARNAQRHRPAALGWQALAGLVLLRQDGALQLERQLFRQLGVESVAHGGSWQVV